MQAYVCVILAMAALLAFFFLTKLSGESNPSRKFLMYTKSLSWYPLPPRLSCPAWNTSASQDKEEYVNRYDGYGTKCNWKGDNWLQLNVREHEVVARTIFETIQPKPGQFLFDWGSGCGQKLRYLEARHEVYGVGIDFSRTSVEYANAHTNRSYFCRADGQYLDWIPSNTFDHSFSFGGLYHLYPGNVWNYTREHLRMPHFSALCNTVNALFRITKPGGKLVFSGNARRPSKQYYVDCIRSIPSLGKTPPKITIVNDWTFFKHKAGRSYHFAPRQRGVMYTVITSKPLHNNSEFSVEVA